ncbi:addiction module antidote protein, HigA family [Companilactobacillus insicii]|uniref:addiction module antidote protein, HigA family n=1 Tax=Companilactobacillus insicii TaxID=1732567 RepID=UPI000F76E700|nr:addiction module antidote protein, HigA family [Companilactobacillus insicii]
MLKISNDNLIAFHPGYYVKRYLDDQDMKQSELADRLNTNEKRASELVNGKIELDDNLIEGLALVFGTSESMWKNLNDKYLKIKEQINRQNQLEEEKNIQKQMDYKFWENLGLVKQTSNTIDKISELRRIFHISSLKVLENRDFLVQYKTAVPEVKNKNVINSNAWVQTALNIGHLKEVSSIDLEYLRSKLPEIRKMTRDDPEKFMPKLNNIFSKSGVAFVIIPNLKNCGVNGAVKWLGKDKVLLAMNDRRKYADVFWFALFHEIRHVFQQKKGHIIISSDKNIGLRSVLDIDTLEYDANTFAQDYLINQKQYEEFVAKNNFSSTSVKEFSDKIDIHSGVVVGRLQRDNYIEYNQLNNLRQKYNIIAKNS